MHAALYIQLPLVLYIFEGDTARLWMEEVKTVYCSLAFLCW